MSPFNAEPIMAMTGRGGLRRFAIVAMSLTRCAVPALLRSGLPLNIVVVIGAIPLFSPNGLSAWRLTSMMQTFVGVRIALWVAWLLVTLPVARGLLTLRAALYLRSLPIPHYVFSLVSAAHLLIVEAGWIVLWWRGQGLLDAIAVGVAAIAVHSLLVTRRRRFREWGALLFVSFAIACRLPNVAVLGVGFAGAAIGLAAAWRTAAENEVRAWPILTRMPPSAALAFAHVFRFWRLEYSILWRGLLMTGGIALWPISAMRSGNIEADVFDRVALAALALPLVAAIVPLAICAQSTDARERDTFHALAVGPGVRQAAALAAVVTCAWILGTACGALIGLGAALSAETIVRFGALEGAWSVGLALLLTAIVWGAPWIRGKRSFPFLMGGLGVLATAAIAVVGLLALPITYALGAVGTVLAARNDATSGNVS